jgi:hypothetical protein
MIRRTVAAQQELRPPVANLRGRIVCGQPTVRCKVNSQPRNQQPHARNLLHGSSRRSGNQSG